ncbi:hypothetical protein [Pseudomonas protegens]|uniref:hypothetical protein n=1 Tax=Pseudomonas protegens TaxID=380021 RepID=UPI001CDAAA53|nr:hypothetical protein [Pseudomonas protegens]
MSGTDASYKEVHRHERQGVLSASAITAQASAGPALGATRSPRELDLPLSSQPLPRHCRHLSWLKRLARAVLAAALLAGLVTWGLHSRFGLLLLLLLR